MTKELYDFIKSSHDIFDGDLEMKEQALDVFIKAKEMEEENIRPDTYVCDCLFLSDFITDDMEEELYYLSNKFFHSERIVKEYTVIEYLPTQARYNSLEQSCQNMILNVIFSAAKQGDHCARNIFCYLYKTYYKKEYGQLKRFKSISKDDVEALANNWDRDDEEGEKYYKGIVRILTMAQMFNIEIQLDCNIFYLMHAEFYQDLPGVKDIPCMDIKKEKVGEAEGIYFDHFEDVKEVIKAEKKMDRYIKNVLFFMGYHEMYINQYENDPFVNYISTLLILKNTFPNAEIRKEEIPIYATIFRCMEVISTICESTQEIFRRIIPFTNVEANDDKRTKLKYENIFAESVQHNNVEKKDYSYDEKSSEKRDGEKKDVYVEELESLRRKLHLEENRNKQLLDQLQVEKRKEAELSMALFQAEENRKELVAIREYLYKITEIDVPENHAKTEQMKDIIKKYNIVIIGGHENWTNKLRKMFPNWKYVSADATSAINDTIVRFAKKVYFFTDSLGHANYHKFMKAIKQCEVPFGYIHGVNIESNIAYIYRDIEDDKDIN